MFLPSQDVPLHRVDMRHSIDSEEGLSKFQHGELSDTDSEWHRLVPPEARVVLDRKEVQRQSILFEIIKSEKDYVADMELVKEVR